MFGEIFALTPVSVVGCRASTTTSTCSGSERSRFLSTSSRSKVSVKARGAWDEDENPRDFAPRDFAPRDFALRTLSYCVGRVSQQARRALRPCRSRLTLVHTMSTTDKTIETCASHFTHKLRVRCASCCHGNGTSVNGVIWTQLIDASRV